jgi:hypothetical protein
MTKIILCRKLDKLRDMADKKIANNIFGPVPGQTISRFCDLRDRAKKQFPNAIPYPRLRRNAKLPWIDFGVFIVQTKALVNAK